MASLQRAAVSCRRRRAAFEARAQYPLRRHRQDGSQYSAHALSRHYAPEVKTGLRGKFAINYVVAMCILDGKLELATFTDEKVNQPQVQEAFSKVQVICDETIPEPGPYCPVTVELKNGTTP